MKKIKIITLAITAALILVSCSNKGLKDITEHKDNTNITSQTEINIQPEEQLSMKSSDKVPKPEEPVKEVAPSPQPVKQPPANVQKPQENTGNKNPASVKGKVVVIDPGHANRSNLEKEPNAPGSTVMKIKDGGGAAGINTKTPEYLINMEVSKRLKPLLEQRGFTVIMTKTEHSQSLGNVERAEIGNNANANLVIRIHADSNENTSANGASMLVPNAVNDGTKAIYGESKRCGEIILNTLTKQVGMRNRGLIFSSDMTGFNWSRVPVILVEMGFLSNPNEDRLLSSAEYQDKLAAALADGITEALK